MGEEKVLTREQAMERAARARERGERIVFTNGCFDLLTPGHVVCLAEAKRCGDLLVVGLNSDESVHGLKGPTRPLYGERDRAMMLAALEAVDVVTIFGEPTPLPLILGLRPDVLIKGEEYALDRVVGAREVLSWGGEVRRVPMREGISTTQTIERIWKMRSVQRSKGEGSEGPSG